MDRAQALLEGGLTQRLHATPHIQPYTVAQHSWGMAMLLLALYPCGQPPQELLWACLTHDVAERWTGDVPATAKWHVAPGIKEPLMYAEAFINSELGINYTLPVEDKAWLKALDLAELWVYCCSEVAMGNTLMAPIRDKCWEMLIHTSWTPKQVVLWLEKYNLEEPRTDNSFGLGT